MTIELNAKEYEELLDAIEAHYGFDLSGYSRASMYRRITRFMINNNLTVLKELREKLLQEDSYFEHFLQELTVNVTEMFRDPSFYKALRAKVIPALKTYSHLRIWDAGCSTGEETYSLAIVLQEESLLAKTRIYATDLNQRVLKTAKEGIYPMAYMKDYSRNYQNAGGRHSLSDYYNADYNNVIMNESLGKNFLFSAHNLVHDGSFNEFNLVVCRNVLIYFTKELQERVLELFLESLPVFGFLALGSKESLRFSKIEKYFEVIDQKEKIFRRINNLRVSMQKKYEAVVMGGSWGGTEAVIEILKGIPAGYPLPIIIVLHRLKNTESHLAEILRKHVQMDVKEINEKEKILPGTVYVAPPNYHVLIEEDRTFSLDVSADISYSRPSIDVLFESAALVYKKKLAGILLTGANADGTEGIAVIRREKGLTVVQDPAEAECSIMPKAAIARTKVDHVLDKYHISELLLSFASQAFQARSGAKEDKTTGTETTRFVKRLEHLLEVIPPLLHSLDEQAFSHQPMSGKWSKKQILGHLIDSAANNHHRFIRMQFEDTPLIFYDQDAWTRAGHYEKMRATHLAGFWEAYNRHLTELITHLPADCMKRTCRMGNGDIVTLEWLIEDYVRHLEHHLVQIVDYAA